MKKIFTTTLALTLCFSFTAFAQTTKPKPATAKNPAPSGTKKPASPSATQAAFNAKDSMLCKQWKVTQTEQFAVKHDLTDVNKNDAMAFMIDKTVIFTMEGKKYTGTWMTDKPKTWVHVTLDGTNEKLRFKIVTLEKTKLALEYRDKDEFYTIYYYDAVK